MANKFEGGVRAGSTSVSVTMTMQSSSTFLGITGLISSNFTLGYYRQGSTPVNVPTAALALPDTAWAQGGIVEVDSLNLPGEYRIDWPDAAFASGADWVILSARVAGSMPSTLKLPLTTNVLQTGDSFALVNTNLDAKISTVPAGVLTAFQASTDWKKLIANVEGHFAFTPPTAYPGTGTLTLYTKDGVTLLSTITLTFNSNKVITDRTAA